VTGALMTVVEASLLLLFPPAEGPWMNWELSYQWGLAASLVVGLLVAVLGLRLGGSDKDLRDLKLTAPVKRHAGTEALH
jgi:hypothetical protein